tara:strand:- start:527 stop:685 length:159 start_codon:yes stop_codon:yes gene_type:complete
MDLIAHTNAMIEAEKNGIPVDWKAAYINLVTDLQRQGALNKAEPAERVEGLL